MPEFPPDFKDVSRSSAECRSFPLRPLSQSSLPLHGNYEIRSFCTEHNVQECLSHISQEVTSLGLDSPWKESGMSSSGVNVVAVLNTLYDLIQLNRRSLQTLESLEVEHVKTSSNVEFLQHTTTRLKEQIEVCKRENAGLLERERRLEAKVKSLQNNLKNEKEEVHKLQNIISNRAIQYNHEMKRKEHEFNKLRERLSQLLADKREKKQSIEISHSIGRANGKRGLWKTEKTEAKHEEEVYKTLLTDYDNRQRELMMENAELRKVLQQMKKDMVLLMSSKKAMPKKEDASDNGVLQAGVEEEDKIDSNKENMELLCSREKLTNSIRLQWRRLKSHVERLDSQVSFVQEEETKAPEHATQEPNQEIGRLNLEVQQYKDLIQAQQKLLQQQLRSPCDEESSSLASDCHMKKEKDHLREEWRSLVEQRKSFEMERSRLTEAAIRLSHERKTFEEDRAVWLKHQFLNFSPFGESSDPQMSNSNSALQLSQTELTTVFSTDELLTSKYKTLKSSSMSDLHHVRFIDDSCSSTKLKKESQLPEELWDFGEVKEQWRNGKENCSRTETQQSNWAEKQ